MSPRVLSLDPRSPEATWRSALDEAVAILRGGGLVAFPTETVYGLGGRALDAGAAVRIFEAKGRPRSHPLIVHVLGEEDARTLASAWSPRAERLARAFWPGPLTLVVPRGARVPAVVAGGGDSIALRAPAHPIARSAAIPSAPGLSTSGLSPHTSTTVDSIPASHGPPSSTSATRAPSDLTTCSASVGEIVW